jgi:hypothetical protein
MSAPERPPLSDEERALARRLSALHGAAEPSPALDARGRAAAREATAPPRRHRRWPAVLGLAASLVLAVGVAWQLQLRPEPTPTPRSEADAARRAQSSPAPAARPAAEPMQARAADVAADSSNTPSQAFGKAATAPTSPPAEPALDEPVQAAAPAEATAKAPLPPPKMVEPVVDVPTPMSLPPPPPAPPTAMPSPIAAPMPAPAPPASFPQRAPVAAGSESRTGNAARDAEQASGRVDDRRMGDEPEGDVPPATANSPEVREAWLQRIHGLIDSGDIAGARASLREFMHRYPDYVLPEDLRALVP